jgi:hypothetical protein
LKTLEIHPSLWKNSKIVLKEDLAGVDIPKKKTFTGNHYELKRND